MGQIREKCATDRPMDGQKDEEMGRWTDRTDLNSQNKRLIKEKYLRNKKIY